MKCDVLDRGGAPGRAENLTMGALQISRVCGFPHGCGHGRWNALTKLACSRSNPPSGGGGLMRPLEIPQLKHNARLLTGVAASLLALFTAPAPAAGPLGAVVGPDGVSFRVWAPNATGVHLRGAFNNWDLSTPMTAEAGGTFSVLVPTARPGQAYKYFITNAAPTPPNATTAWRRDPESRLIEPFVAGDSNSVIHDPAAYTWSTPDTFSRPPLNRLVIYEMHIGSFNAPTGTPGTFAQAVARLDQIAALGVNAVQIMPVHENVGANRWGYDPLLMHAIEVEYGGPDGFKAFVDACHARGLAVILDVVYNHASLTQNDMWNFDLWSEGTGGGIWFFNDAANRDTPWGPRFDYRREEIRTFVLEGLRRFMTEYRVDGFRFDATGIMRIGSGGAVAGAAALLRDCTAMVKAEFPGRYMIAEDFQTDYLATVPAASGGLGFDSEWSDFAYDAVRLLTSTAAAPDMTEMIATLGERFSGDPFRKLIFVESHDTAATEDAPSQTFPYRGAYLPARINRTDAATNVDTCKRSMLGSVLTLTAPGVPMLFMGQEAYATSTFAYPNPPALNWTALLTANGGIQTLHKDLIALRLNRAGNTGGLLGGNVNVYHRNTPVGVMAYLRTSTGGAGDETVVLMNCSGTAFGLGYQLGVPRAGVWKVRFNSDWTTYNTQFTTTPGAQVALTTQAGARDGWPQFVAIPALPARSAMILSQDPTVVGWTVK